MTQPTKPKSAGRKPGDGRGRLGGRAKGTPNKKDAPLKNLLRDHTAQYFDPSLPALDNDGNPTGGMESQFARDCRDMKPNERAALHVQILPYVTPRMQTVQADIDIDASRQSIANRLASLSDIP